MTDKPIRIPGPDHPITIEPASVRVRVRAGDHVVADTGDALVLREAAYPAVFYIPREHADLALLTRTDHASYCPYKGDAAYFSLPADVPQAENAIWTYEAPYAAVAPIRDHLAFYADRVTIEELPLA
jgi:uncharacterized protein (DUF427 family)